MWKDELLVIHMLLQVVIQSGPEEEGYITVETDCIQSGHVQGVLCPARNLVKI